MPRQQRPAVGKFNGDARGPPIHSQDGTPAVQFALEADEREASLQRGDGRDFPLHGGETQGHAFVAVHNHGATPEVLPHDIAAGRSVWMIRRRDRAGNVSCLIVAAIEHADDTAAAVAVHDFQQYGIPRRVVEQSVAGWSAAVDAAWHRAVCERQGTEQGCVVFVRLVADVDRSS